MQSNERANRELIAKLESASEGSRELDADVWCATIPGGASYDAERDRVTYPDKAWFNKPGFEHYTTSIDAALALAERKGYDPSEILHAAWAAVVRKHALHMRSFDGAFYTQAIALAICAALLRAVATR